MDATMLLAETLAFVTVVEAGTFTAAARKLGVPKSTLSRQVSRLEEQLGARLLQRTTRKLSLTEPGTAYFEQCHHAIEAIEQAGRVALDTTGVPRGSLKVSLPFDLARAALPGLLPKFRARYPEIELQFVVTHVRLDLVAEGIDVALRGGAPADSGLIARRLLSSEVVLSASPEYLDRRGRPQTIADLADHDGLMMTDGADALRRMPGPDGIERLPLRPCVSINEWGVLLRAQLAGLGIGPMITQWAREHFDAGRLERVLPEYGFRDGGVYAVYPSRRYLPAKVRVFIDFVADELGHGLRIDG